MRFSGPVGSPSQPRRQRLDYPTGAHAAVLAASIPASRTRHALLGGSGEYGCSFPPTEVRHLDPIRIFRAALRSRSCKAPHSLHTQDLTVSPLTPRGPLRAPQAEQVTLVFRSLTTSKLLAACLALYSRNLLSIPQPESSTDFAIRVRTSLRLLTSPTAIF